MQSIRQILLVILTFASVLSACSARPTQVQPTAAPTPVIESAPTIASGDLPLIEADVPRVSVEEAKAAFDSGLAIIVDVRHPNHFETSHIAGAISLPLGEIETELTSLTLDKEQWIITYCTWQNEHQSARAAFILLHNGYARVEALLGGFDAWADAGLPVEP